MIITDRDKLRYCDSREGDLKISDEYLMPDDGYTRLDSLSNVGMKPLGRIYFGKHEHLDYTDGTPVEKALIDGGEKGVIDEYQKAGKRIYTEEQVINIINSRCYESNDELKPKITPELETFLKELSENKAKDKPKRAAELLGKYSVISKEDN